MRFECQGLTVLYNGCGCFSMLFRLKISVSLMRTLQKIVRNPNVGKKPPEKADFKECVQIFC